MKSTLFIITALLTVSLTTTAATTIRTPSFTCPTLATYSQGVLNLPKLALLNPFEPSYIDQEARYLDPSQAD